MDPAAGNAQFIRLAVKHQTVCPICSAIAGLIIRGHRQRERFDIHPLAWHRVAEPSGAPTDETQQRRTQTLPSWSQLKTVEAAGGGSTTFSITRRLALFRRAMTDQSRESVWPFLGHTGIMTD